MSFFSPLHLLWLLPMAGLIVLMYILKLRRKDVFVSSTLLWRQVIRDVQANAPFQKLRKNLLLLLQLLAVLLVVLAYARPFSRGQGIGGRSVVILVDTSASMTATDTDSGRSRLDEGKREAMKVVADMRPGDQMMVLSAAAKPEAVTGFTRERSELARAIDGLTPHETGTNMRDAVNLAAALVGTRDASEIDVISDGAFAPVTSVNLGKTPVLFHQVGTAARNVGITGVDYRRSLVGEKTIQVFVTAHNFDSRPHTFNVVLAHEGDTLDAHEVTLPPNGENPDIFDVPEPTEPVTIRVTLENIRPKDDLPADNVAAMVIEPRKPIKALLVTEGNPFLEKSIEVDPNVNLTVSGRAGFRGPKDYDAVVFDGWAPKTLPEGDYLFVDCQSDQCPARPGGEAENQGIVDVTRNHPALRYVDFGSTRWTSMRHGVPHGWAQEIATSESGGAIIAGEKGKMRALWTGFALDLAHGTFPLTVGYPIFVSNAVRWLAHSDEATSQIRAGQPIALDAPPAAGQVTVVKPDGAKRTLSVPARGGVLFDDTDQVGAYTATGGAGYRRVFAANLADYAESDIAPHRQFELEARPAQKPGRPVTVVRELWPWLAVVLLGLLAVEWWAFHRRVWVT